MTCMKKSCCALQGVDLFDLLLAHLHVATQPRSGIETICYAFYAQGKPAKSANSDAIGGIKDFGGKASFQMQSLRPKALGNEIKRGRRD